MGEVCDIIYGTRIVKNQIEPGEYPVYGSGRAMFYTKTFNREGYNIIIGRFALSLECVRFINEKIFLNDSGLSIKSKHSYIIDKYLGYYLLSNQDYIYNLSRGAAQKNLDIDKFKLMKIPIPTIEKQEEIVKYLDSLDNKNKLFEYSNNKLFELLLNTSDINDRIELFNNIENANIDINNQINKLFELNNYKLKIVKYNPNIEIKTLDEVCSIDQGNQLTKKEMVNGLFDVIGGGKIIGKHNKYNRNGNEITLTRVGDININYINEQYYLTDNCFSLKSIIEYINTKYIYYYLYNNKEILLKLYIGMAQKVISKTNLKLMKIPIPSIEKQEEIIEYCDNNLEIINNLKKTIENNKIMMKELF